ncbi:hypothetical protein FJZ23_01805 [Candidatus Parcubacteria bacterium]|nr:hypothetical protein [Candidatus Parcubacteria bacterium]
MRYSFPGPLPDHARNLMRRMGYGEQRARSGQISYVKRVSSDRFPRYHAYVEDTAGGGMQVNLHVDQKEASYEGTSAHAGEYDGPLVEREMNTITAFVTSVASAPPPSPPVAKPKKNTSFFSRFF